MPRRRHQIDRVPSPSRRHPSRRRPRVAPVIVLLFTCGAAGCRIAARRTGAVLEVWSAPTGLEEKAFQRLCRRFEVEHPGAQIHNVGALNEQQLVRAIVAGAPPDLAYLYNEAAVGPLAANGAVEPLDARFAASGLREDAFLPGAIAQQRYRGTLYAMPTTRDCRALFWNRACFREAGLDPDAPPRTLEEAISVAARLTRRAADGSVERLGFYLPDDPFLVFALFGGSPSDARTGAITADRPENVRALTWLHALAAAQGGYSRIARFMTGFGDDSSGQNPIGTGKVAMRITGEWAAMDLQKYAPAADYGVGSIPYPSERPDLRNLAFQDGDVMLIPIGSRHAGLAWEFMAWMQRPEEQVEYAAEMNNLPTIRAARTAQRLIAGSPSRRTLGYILRSIASDGHNARFVAPLPITQLYRASLVNAFQRTLYSETTPARALQDVQRRMTAELRRYGG